MALVPGYKIRRPNNKLIVQEFFDNLHPEPDVAGPILDQTVEIQEGDYTVEEFAPVLQAYFDAIGVQNEFHVVTREVSAFTVPENLTFEANFVPDFPTSINMPPFEEISISGGNLQSLPQVSAELQTASQAIFGTTGFRIDGFDLADFGGSGNFIFFRSDEGSFGSLPSFFQVKKNSSLDFLNIIPAPVSVDENPPVEIPFYIKVPGITELPPVGASIALRQGGEIVATAIVAEDQITPVFPNVGSLFSEAIFLNDMVGDWDLAGEIINISTGIEQFIGNLSIDSLRLTSFDAFSIFGVSSFISKDLTPIIKKTKGLEVTQPQGIFNNLLITGNALSQQLGMVTNITDGVFAPLRLIDIGEKAFIVFSGPKFFLPTDLVEETTTTPKIDRQTDLAIKYLPSGRSFEAAQMGTSNLHKLMRGFGRLFSRQLEALKLTNEEIFPDRASFLEEWERALGIPDDCIPRFNTIEERLKMVRLKLVLSNVQVAEDLIAVAKEVFDIDITVDPGIVSFNAGNPHGFLNEKEARFTIVVTFQLLDQEVFPYTYPIPFGREGFTVLSCLFERLVPANVQVIFVEQ